MGFPFGVVTHMRKCTERVYEMGLENCVYISHNTLIKYPKEFAFCEEKKRKSFKNMRG